MIVGIIGQSLQQYKNIVGEGEIEMKSPRPEGDSHVANDKGEWVISEELIAEQAQSEMIEELNWCDLQLKYHATGDTKRAISTVELINAYAVECRDYVQNVDGVLTIVGDKPSRPE